MLLRNRKNSKFETMSTLLMHEWGCVRKLDSKVIATCKAYTYFEACDIFAAIGYNEDMNYEIKIIKNWIKL